MCGSVCRSICIPYAGAGRGGHSAVVVWRSWDWDWHWWVGPWLEEGEFWQAGSPVSRSRRSSSSGHWLGRLRYRTFTHRCFEPKPSGRDPGHFGPTELRYAAPLVTAPESQIAEARSNRSIGAASGSLSSAEGSANTSWGQGIGKSKKG